MDRMIARLNIEHFLARLSVETDEMTWQTLLHLLAEERAKLAALNAAHLIKAAPWEATGNISPSRSGAIVH